MDSPQNLNVYWVFGGIHQNNISSFTVCGYATTLKQVEDFMYNINILRHFDNTFYRYGSIHAQSLAIYLTPDGEELGTTFITEIPSTWISLTDVMTLNTQGNDGEVASIPAYMPRMNDVSIHDVQYYCLKYRYFVHLIPLTEQRLDNPPKNVARSLKMLSMKQPTLYHVERMATRIAFSAPMVTSRDTSVPSAPTVPSGPVSISNLSLDVPNFSISIPSLGTAIITNIRVNSGSYNPETRILTIASGTLTYRGAPGSPAEITNMMITEQGDNLIIMGQACISVFLLGRQCRDINTSVNAVVKQGGVTMRFSDLVINALRARAGKGLRYVGHHNSHQAHMLTPNYQVFLAGLSRFRSAQYICYRYINE